MGLGRAPRALRPTFPRQRARQVALAEGFADFGRIAAPTLVLAEDRDVFCTPEEGATVYR